MWPAIADGYNRRPGKMQPTDENVTTDKQKSYDARNRYATIGELRWSLRRAAAVTTAFGIMVTASCGSHCAELEPWLRFAASANSVFFLEPRLLRDRGWRAAVSRRASRPVYRSSMAGGGGSMEARWSGGFFCALVCDDARGAKKTFAGSHVCETLHRTTGKATEISAG